METVDRNHLRKLVQEAPAVFISAGAGMGVDSGLPDFRGSEGFWKAYPIAKKMNLEFHELANPRWFVKEPELAWAFYGHRLNLYRQTRPHAGYRMLLEYVQTRPEGYFIFTSNVDGHFQKAGFRPENIEECHGSILHFQCQKNCRDDIFSAGQEEIQIDESTFRAMQPLPVCPHCGATARPNILMFGDWGWNGRRTEEQQERLTKWVDGLLATKTRPVIIEIGAGLAVPTVRMTSEQVARMTGGVLIRINPRDRDVPSGAYALPLKGLEGIRALLED